MAITWGAVRSTPNGYGFRIGYEITQNPATVTAATSSVTLTAKLYLQTRWAVYDQNNTFSWSGDFGSGSTSFAFSTTHKTGSGWSSENIRLVRTLTRTVSPSYSGSIRSSVSASLTGIDVIPGTAKVSGSATTAAKPLSAPRPPSSATATYVSDSRIDLAWARVGQNSADRPYVTTRVQRWDSVSNTYQNVATLGNVNSYVDRSTEAGKRYRYRIGAFNSAGGSGWVYTPYIYTSPLAPKSVTARRNADGSVSVSWTPGSGATGYYVVWQYGSGAWKYDLGVTVTGTSWTHTNPETSAPVRYAVLAQAGERRSAYTHSEPLQLLAAPLAPTRLSPSGGQVLRSGDTVRFSWQHNPVDGTDQRAYALRYREAGTTTWRGGSTVYSGASSATITDAEIAGWAGIDWQVRTWGTSTTAGEWSAIATAALLEPPAVTLTRPAEGSTLTGDSTEVWYRVHDPNGDTYTSFSYELEVRLDGSVIYRTSERWGTGGQTEFYYRTKPLPVRFGDAQTYSIRMRVQSGAGLWSAWDSVTFTTKHALPPAPQVDSAVFDVGSGVVAVTASVPDSPTEMQSTPVSLAIWRAVTGSDWELVADGLDPAGATIVDPLAPTGVSVSYRAVVTSDIESTATSEPVTLHPDAEGWIYLSAGPGWSEMIRVRDSAKLSTSLVVPKTTVRLAGRRAPVEIVGEGETWTASLSVRLAPHSEGASLREVQRFCARPAPICVRTPKGDRRFVSVSPADGSEEAMLESGSWTLTEVDHDLPAY